jgi:hypothetical protein
LLIDILTLLFGLLLHGIVDGFGLVQCLTLSFEQFGRRWRTIRAAGNQQEGTGAKHGGR